MCADVMATSVRDDETIRIFEIKIYCDHIWSRNNIELYKNICEHIWSGGHLVTHI